jgi:hypothetical protein
MFRIDLDRIRERGHGPDMYRTAAAKAEEQAVVWDERGRQDNAEHERHLAARWLEIADLLEAEGEAGWALEG